MKIKSVKNILKRLIVAVLVVVMLVVLPSVELKQNEDLSRIYSVFLGTKSKYQGIIEIWNIDTFESGKVSKEKVLNEIAQSFQNQNKGLYIMIRNLTEYECLNLIQSGEMPDLFSCSYGVAEKIKPYVKSFQSVDVSNIDSAAINAGMLNDAVFGVPWCKGSYYLISTVDKLQKANIENIDNIDLMDICLNKGYLVHGKKSDKVVYSLSFGNSKYLMPQQVLKSYNKQEVEINSNYSFHKDSVQQTGYSAYCNFIAGNSVVLLGTQRDVFRMENRIKLGKISDVVCKQLTNFCDLIQFVLMPKNNEGDKLEYTEKFVNFLIAKSSQEKVFDNGMLSVEKGVKNAQNESTMQNITPQNFSDYAAPMLFIDEKEINSLQQF